MGCIKDKIVEDLISKVKHSKRDSFKFEKNSIFIPDTVVSANNSNYGIVRYIEKQLRENYEKTYGMFADAKLGDLTSLEPLKDGIRIHISPSNSLEKAIQYNQDLIKEEELAKTIQEDIEANQREEFIERDRQANQFFDVDGNVYPTAEDLINAQLQEIDEYDSFSPVPRNQILITPDYSNYVSHKEKLITKINKTIQKLYNDKAINNNNHINRKITKFTNIKEELEKDIYDFGRSNDKVDTIDNFFKKDFNTINSLLSQPTIENIFLAKDLFNYIKTVADIRISNAKRNKLFNPRADGTYEPKVYEVLKTINEQLNNVENEIEKALDTIFLQLLEKNSTNLKSLYPNKTLEQIKDILLEDMQDIGWVESLFFAQGENLFSENNIIEALIRIEYEKEEFRQQSRAKLITAEIDAALEAAEKELTRLGKKVKSTLNGLIYSGYDYRFLYQKDEKGDYKSTLIGKFSSVWDNFNRKSISYYNKKVFEARQNRDWAELEKVLQDKYNDFSDKVEYVNIGLLHDVFTDPIYDSFKRGDTAQADIYRQELIDKIGREEYDMLVQNQRNLLDNYFEEVNAITQFKLAQKGVSSINDLSDADKLTLQITLRRLNPQEFYDSHVAGRGPMIQYTSGTRSDEKPSYQKYNTYIPKERTNSGIATKFYDYDFDFIEKNPAIYELWKALRKGNNLINENLIDSNLKLKANSLLSMKKTFSEEMVNESFLHIAKRGLGKLLNIKQFIKNVVSAKLPDYDKNTEDIVLPQHIQSFDAEVAKEFALLKTDIANILGKQVLPTTVIDFKSLSLDKQKAISEALGFNSVNEFINDINKSKFKFNDLRRYSERKIMEQQTLNVPTMIKAFLELSAEHKARTNAQNEINIYREKSSYIKSRDNTARRNKGSERTKERSRSDFFNDKIILNKVQEDHSGNITKFLVKKANKNDFRFIGRHFYKNFTKEEKRIYDSAIERLEKIEVELQNINNPNQATALLKEQRELDARIRILGKDYLISALYNNVVNKLTVQVGLGYNIVANIKNKLQGLTSLLSRDGEFWTKGNIYPVNHFTNLNKLRFMNPSYKEQWDIATLFIKQLNLIQDGTNELQRAESKIKRKTRFLHPMYGTEVVEYYNQVPGILAMAMDIEIEDKNGNKHPFFDGSKFTAYQNDNGILKLKEEFRTPENIQHYEKMDSNDMVNWKSNVSEMIRSLNGDYSRTGVTQIKGNIYTRPVMTFKTWVAKYFHSRIRYQQKNIRTGQIEDGYLISTFLNKKTSFAGGLMLGFTGLLGIASQAPLIITLPIFMGMIGLGTAVYRMSKNNRPQVDSSDVISLMSQAVYALESIAPWKLAEVPVNSILGKEFIKSPEFRFGQKDKLTAQEQRDVRLLVRNMQNVIIMMLAKLALQAFLRDNDEDEPKGERGSEQRKRYEAQQKENKEWKRYYNFLENTLTGLYADSALITEPASLLNTMGSKNGLQNFFDKTIKTSVTLIRASHGEDEIQKGERQGQSKTGNAFRKMVLPSLFRDIGHDTWRGGFESSLEREWVTNEGIDGIFDSDYKVDKKKATEERQKDRLHYIENYEEKYDVDFDDLSIDTQEKVTRKAKRYAKKQHPNPKRSKYDDDQNLKE